MAADPTEIGEDDLNAYVDDQLPLVRRADVEAWLARNPAVAARVMADLSGRDTLRAALGGPVEHGPRVRAAAARLERAFAWRATAASLRRAAAIALLVGAGWMAHAMVGAGVGESVAA